MIIAMITFFYAPYAGEHTIAYNYVRTRYGWEVEEYSTYKSIAEAMSIIGKFVLFWIFVFLINGLYFSLGQAVFIPALTLLHIRDSIVMPTVLCSCVVRNLLNAFAAEGWMYYLGMLHSLMLEIREK